jgi:hypothetical protein
MIASAIPGRHAMLCRERWDSGKLEQVRDNARRGMGSDFGLDEAMKRPGTVRASTCPGLLDYDDEAALLVDIGHVRVPED